jgi:hypothetical protein
LLPLVATRALAAWLAFLFISFSTAHHTINYPVIYDALFGPIKSTILHIKGGKLRAASLLIAFMNVRRAKINCRHRRRRPPALANNLSRLVCVCVSARRGGRLVGWRGALAAFERNTGLTRANSPCYTLIDRYLLKEAVARHVRRFIG